MKNLKTFEKFKELINENYIMIPIVGHRDPVVKLGKTIKQIQDNMVGFLYDYYQFPEDYPDDIEICYKIRDHKYTSIEELISDCEKVCNGYSIQRKE
jgi:hypothetical protein